MLTTLLSPVLAQAGGGLSQSLLVPGIDQADLLSSSVAFLPERLICFGIVLLLVMRLLPALDRMHLGGVALAVTLVALAVSVLQWLGVGLDAPETSAQGTALMYGDRASGLLVYDHF